MQARNKKIMPEQIDQAAVDAAAAQAEIDAKAAEDQAGDQTPEQKKAADDAAAAEADAIAKKAEEDNKEPEIRARKTAKDFIIERQAKKLAKAGAPKAGEEDDDKGGDSDEDDDVDEEDEKVVRKVASKMLAPIFEEQIAKADDAEVKDFLASNKDFAPYEAKVRTYMKHPSRRDLPIESIFYEVAGPDLLKLGAARAKAADDEARENGAGGGDGGGEDEKSGIDAVTTVEEMAAYKVKLREKMRG